MHPNTLAEERRERATEAYENYDFGVEVVAANGWESDGSDDMTRIVFLADSDPTKDSVRTRFGVRFNAFTAQINATHMTVRPN